MKKPTPEKIREVRKAAGLTQTQAAELVHASLRAWQMWEAGDREIGLASWELFILKTASGRQYIKDYVDISVSHYGGIR